MGEEFKNENQPVGNKMATMPVGKLMINTGAPMILSMMLQAVYNIVDSYFVSNMPDSGGMVHVGESAVNALTLAFPVQMLIVAFSVGTGVGVNVLLAKTLGQGESEKGGRVAGNALFLGGVIYLVTLLFGLFGVDVYLASQTTDAVVIDMAAQYLRICCVVSMGMVYFSMFEKILQATGRSKLSTIAQITGALTNIVLDPIMIYGLLGCPAMGIRGAAYATVIGQIASAALGAWFHFHSNKEVHITLAAIKPDGRIIGGIYTIGVPAIISQAVMSVMTYGINIIFAGVSSAYVVAYGIFYKIQQFVLFAAFGLRDAITPIVSYNYGRQDKARVHAAVRWGMIYTLGIMAICWAALEIFASPLAGAFSLSEATNALCVQAMRVVSVSFIFAGVNIALQGVFQALGRGVESLILSLLRQIVFVLPLAWLFARYAVGFVWISFVLAEVLTAAIACVMYKSTDKKLFPAEDAGTNLTDQGGSQL